MPLHPSQYGHKIKDKLEAEAVAANREALDRRLHKRAVEIDAEGDGGIAGHPALQDAYKVKSPAFPTVAEAKVRRQQARKRLAEAMVAVAIVPLAYSLIFGGVVGCILFLVIVAAAAVTSYRNE